MLDISRNKIISLVATTTNTSGSEGTTIVRLPNLTHFNANGNLLARLPDRIDAPLLQHLFLS